MEPETSPYYATAAALGMEVPTNPPATATVKEPPAPVDTSLHRINLIHALNLLAQLPYLQHCRENPRVQH